MQGFAFADQTTVGVCLNHAVIRLISLISLNMGVILAWLHGGTVTISDKISDCQQIRLRFFSLVLVPSTYPDNERSTENKTEHIFSSNAKNLLALASLYEMALKWSPLLKIFIGFYGEICFRKGRWVRHIQGFACWGTGIYRITAHSLSSPSVFHLSVPSTSSIIIQAWSTVSARALIRWKVALDSTYLTRSGLRLKRRGNSLRDVFKVKQLVPAPVLIHLFHYSSEKGAEPGEAGPGEVLF